MSNKIKTIPILTIILASMIVISSQYSETFAEKPPAMVSMNPGSSAYGCDKTNNCFNPSSITIESGDSVTWSNHYSGSHTVTSGVPGAADGFFDSNLIKSNTTFSLKFDGYEPGTYPYFCIVHPWMIGEVIVQEKKHEDNSIRIGGAHDPAKIHSLDVLGTEYSIEYRISSGQVTNAIANNDTISIILQLNQVTDGALTITLPRDLIDAKTGTQDDVFTIIYDEEQIDYNEIRNSVERKLIIPFPEGDEIIEIIGTKIAVAPTIPSILKTESEPLLPKSVSSIPNPESLQTQSPTSSKIDEIVATASSEPECEDTNNCLIPSTVRQNNLLILLADKSVYEDGEKIKIEGIITGDSSFINLKAFNPSKFNIANERIKVSENGNFEKEFDTSNYIWYENGEYVILAEDLHGNTDRIKVIVDEPREEFTVYAQENVLDNQIKPIDEDNNTVEIILEEQTCFLFWCW